MKKGTLPAMKAATDSSLFLTFIAATLYPIALWRPALHLIETFELVALTLRIVNDFG